MSAAFLLAVLPSCGGGNKIDPVEDPEVELLIDTTLIFIPEGDTHRVTIRSHASWKAQVVQGGAWCTMTPTSGGSGGATIAIKAGYNDEFAVRKALIKIESSIGKGTIEVIQQQIDVLDLTVDDSCDFGPQGGTFAVKADYNIDYSISCDADWVHQIETRALQHATLTFAVDKNNSGGERSCNLTFEGSGISHTVTVYQDAAYVSLSVDDLYLGDTDTYLPLMVESNISYHITMPDNDWLTHKGEMDGGHDGEVTATTQEFDLPENAGFFLRECEVKFSNPDYNVVTTLHLTQKALDILYESFPLEAFGPDGGSFSFDIDPTSEYTVSTGDASWIKVETPQEYPYRRIVTVDKNLTGEDRAGGVKITRASRSKTLDVVQKGAFIDISADKVAFSSMGGSQSLTVGGNVEYEVTKPDASWCTIEESEAGVFTITAARNEEEQGRECLLTFTNEEYKLKYTIAIAQAQLDAFEVDPTSFELVPQGGRIEVGIHSNVEFDCEIDAGWITEYIAGRTSQKRVYDIARNGALDGREGHLTFTGAGIEHVVTVTQRSGTLTVSPRSFEFDDAAAQGVFSVSGNIDFQAKTLGGDWLTIKEVTASDVAFALTENNEWGNRRGEIVVFNPDYETADTVIVFQGAKYYLDIEQTEFSLQPEGGRVELKVTSNKDYDYHIAGSPDWIREISPLVFEIGLNAASEAREAEIVFEQNGLQKSVFITQDAPYLVVDKQQLEFAAAGGEATLTVTGNVPFDVETPEAPWVECARSSASSFTVTVAANDMPEIREATILVTASDYGCSAQVKVVQAEKGIFELLTTEFSLGPEGGSAAVEVNTNVDYTYTVSDSWILDGEGLEFEIAKNLAPEERTGKIEFSANGYTYEVTVRQEAAILEVEPLQLLFPVDGGEGSFTVSGNIDYEISVPDEEWLSCAIDDGTCVVTVAANSSDADRECSISVVSEDYEREIKVAIVQPRSDFFDLLTPEFHIGPDMAQLEIEIATNIDYIYTVSEDWVEDAGDLKFAVARNTTAEARECTISFEAAGETYVATIVQEAPYLTFSETDFTLDSLGGSLTLEVSANVPFTADIPEADWLSCTAEGNEYHFDVAKNDDYRPRTYSLEFEAADFGLSQTVTLTQTGNEDARPFSLKTRDNFIGPTGGELEIVHTKCSDVEVFINGAGWIREIPSKRNDTLLVFSVDSMFSTVNRQAVISVRGKGRTVTGYVFQNPPLMVLTYHERHFKDVGGTAPIEMVANFTPDFYTDQDWVSGSVAEDRSFISFTVAPNDTGLERTAVVEVGLKRMNYVQEVTITQDANDMIIIEPNEIEASASGGGYYVTIAANVPFSPMEVASWISIDQTEAPNVFKVGVEANGSAYSRSARIMFNGGKATAYLAVNQEGYRNPDYYYSEDFSRNHTSVVLQRASEGEGIPLVLMGDAFSDRLIEDGTYDTHMRRAVEAIFAIEPYKSFRNLFDIYYINVVSMNEIYADDATTELSTRFVQGTVVIGDHAAVRNLALNLLDPISIKNAAIVVLMNSETYGGSTYLYDYLGQDTTDYGKGEAIAYVPLCSTDEQFTIVMQHEVGGHVIGKLEDEYYYDTSEAIPAAKVAEYKTYQAAGFYKNVDFTADPAEVLWAKFLTDEDYQYDGLGVFEGACIYSTGAYRSSEDSMMYHNEGRFNAPSREAIYYRLHKVAYGLSWQYDFDAFKQYDAINRRTSPSASQSGLRRASPATSSLPPLPPPVMLKQ